MALAAPPEERSASRDFDDNRQRACGCRVGRFTSFSLASWGVFIVVFASLMAVVALTLLLCTSPPTGESTEKTYASTS